MKVLKRAASILDAFLQVRSPLRLEQVCKLTSLPKTTAYRLIVALLESHYLIETEEGYWLGLRLLELGSLVEDRLDLKQQAAPFLKQLRDEVNETVHLGMLDDDLRVLYVDKLLPQRAVVAAMMSRVGVTAPMHCTALGKVMVAFRPEDEVRKCVELDGLDRYTEATITEGERLLKHLREVRSQGYAVDNGEFEEPVRCVAAPVWGRNGSVLGAVSVTMPEDRMPRPIAGSRVLRAVMQTAQAISEAMGYVCHPTNTSALWAKPQSPASSPDVVEGSGGADPE